MNIIKCLCESLLLSKNQIVSFSLGAPHRYKTYEIPKRNSFKKRVIAHPSRELKFFQRVLSEYLGDKLKVHGCAYAYKKGVGIKANAEVHVNSKYLLKMDFTNFFPSISPSLFFMMLEKHGIKLEEIDETVLKNLLFWKETKKSSLKLSIGAPSSPLISNFIMYYFDCEMKKYCEDIGIKYTRYADDLTFSTNQKNILFDVPGIVEVALKKQMSGSIRINANKTVFSSRGHNRHVTGVTITNDGGLSVGRERKRLISSMIHKYKLGALDEEEVQKLRGLLSFATYIEPEFQDRMCRKYDNEIIMRLRKASNE